MKSFSELIKIHISKVVDPSSPAVHILYAITSGYSFCWSSRAHIQCDNQPLGIIFVGVYQTAALSLQRPGGEAALLTSDALIPLHAYFNIITKGFIYNLQAEQQ